MSTRLHTIREVTDLSPGIYYKCAAGIDSKSCLQKNATDIIFLPSLIPAVGFASHNRYIKGLILHVFSNTLVFVNFSLAVAKNPAIILQYVMQGTALRRWAVGQ